MASPSPIIATLDEAGLITRVNEPWLRFGSQNGARAGWTGVGTSYLAVCEEAGAIDAAQAIRSALRGDSPAPVSYACHAPHHARWFDLVALPLPHGAMAVHLDNTQRHRAEQLVKLGSALTPMLMEHYDLRAAAQHTTQAVGEALDAEAVTIHEVTEGGVRVLHRWQPERAAVAPVSIAATPEAQRTARWEAAPTGGSVIAAPFQIDDRPTGVLEVQLLDAVPPEAIFGAVVAIAVRLGNAVGRYRALRRLGQLFEAAPAAMLQIAADGRIVRANQRALAALGHASLTGVSVEVLVPPDVRAQHEASRERVVGLGAVRSAMAGRELSVLRADGTRFPAEIGLSELELDDDRWILASIHDLTERKGLDAALDQARRLEALGRLSAGIAHEINTPLQFIGDNVAFLVDHMTTLAPAIRERVSDIDDPRQRRRIERAIGALPVALRDTQDGLARVSEIVQAMTAHAHPANEERGPIDVNAAIESTLIVARNEWRYVADVTCSLAPDLPSVDGYQGPFQQAILNLVLNAAHAVAARHAPSKGHIRVASRALDDLVEVEISDDGTGIPEQVKTRMFEPFFTTKPVGRGTGQGLAVVHAAIVTKHGGTIDVTSAVGVGTTFRIRLPANR